MTTAPLSNLTATWNAGGTTFNAIKMNVTDTASAAGSMLLDLQVGGTSQFRVSKGGRVTALGRATIDTLTIGLGGQTAVADNTAVGFQALNSASLTGQYNVGVGYQALLSNTTGSENIAMGFAALYSNTAGANNIAVGHRALQSNLTGQDNVGVGYHALLSNTTGSENIAMGLAALYSNTAGANNIAVGHRALQSNTTGGNNSAAGAYALYFNTTGGSNSAVGKEALYSNTTGSYHSAMGVAALYSNTTGANNSAIGFQALAFNTTGSDNTGIGEQAGDVITTGARNTIVGANSDPSANNGNDQTVIGEGLTGKGDDTFFCGGTNGAYNEKNVTTWETTSDARIKKDIADFADGLEVLEQVRVRSFRYRTPDEITDLPASAAINQPGVQLGVIAQELQAVLPECVTENSTGVLSVNTDPLVWYLINAVQQLSAEVKTLKGL